MAVEKSDGETIIDPEGIVQEFTEYFQAQLGVQKDHTPFQGNFMQHGKIITAGQQNMLTRLPTNEEIKQVLFSIGDLKAPGPDGYNSKFYKEAWETIQHDFTAAVMEFFQNGKLLKAWNHTLIALIPKMEHTTKV